MVFRLCLVSLAPANGAFKIFFGVFHMSTKKNVVYYRQQTEQDIAEKLSVETATVNELPSLTVQGPAQEADINYIAKMFGLNASSKLPLPPEALDARYYGDFTEAPADLQTALERVREANERFSNLPAKVREKFDHNPAALWTWLQDPANAAEAVELGILHKAADPAPVPAPLDNAAE